MNATKILSKHMSKTEAITEAKHIAQSGDPRVLAARFKVENDGAFWVLSEANKPA